MIPEQLQNLIKVVEKKANRYTLFISVVMLQFVLIGSYCQVHGQTDGTLDVNELYRNEAVDGPYVASGDQNANNLAFVETQKTSEMVSTWTLLAGYDSIEGASARADEVGMPTMARQGILGVVDNEVTTMLVNPPGVDIPGHLMAQWVPGQSRDVTVYAQGAGYNFLKNDVGLEPVWEMFRDIAYAGFVLILMIAGLMIMFRSKIGGQVTVGIMNTIPGVLIGLVLVTFSFAIVGFIIDIGRLISFVILHYMNLKLSGSGFQAHTLPNDPFSIAWDAFNAVPIVRDLTSPISLIGGSLLPLIVPGLGTLVTAAGALVVLVIMLICLYASVKVYITLITSYIKIVIDLVLGPIFILMGSLPGKSESITTWLKRLVASTLVFPVVLFILNLSRYIGFNSDIDTSSPTAFMSGGDPSPGFIFQIRGLIVIAGYLIAAGAPGMIDEALAIVASKGVGAAVEGAKKTAGKIPLVGGFFG